MTDIKFYKNENSEIIMVQTQGHTGYAEENEDILCAAISSLVQTAALGLLMEAKINVDIIKDEKIPYFKIQLPDVISKQQRHDANIILNTLLLGISDLYEGFSDFINLEVI